MKNSVQSLLLLTATAGILCGCGDSKTGKVFGSIRRHLAVKAKSLSQSLGVNDALKSQLDGALQSLTAGKDSTALGQVFQVAQAATNLTPEQQQLAKDVGNLASAYV